MAARAWAQRGLPALVAGLALIGALDEISFGERLFGLTMPRVAGYKIDGLHDFAMLFNGVPWRGWLLLLGLLAVAAWLLRDRLRVWLPVAAMRLREPPVALFALFALQLATAVMLDLRPRGEPWSMLEEMLEATGAAALCCCAISLRRAIRAAPA